MATDPDKARTDYWEIRPGDGTGKDAIRANRQFLAIRAASLKPDLEESLRRRLKRAERA